MIRDRVFAMVIVAAVTSACDGGNVRPIDASVDAVRDVAHVRESDRQIVARCLSCHTAIADDWSRVSSHRLLYACTVCHTERNAMPGPGHEERPACQRCHSEHAHPVAANCTGCHAPHGSSNAFLIRPSIQRPDGTQANVYVTQPAGRSANGFVRGGIADAGADGSVGTPGTGLCETCHTTTRFYTRRGDGAPHPTRYCGECHAHVAGFAP